MQISDNIFKNSTPHDNYIIFDVDRTIINCTSWYHACICPDLLIEKSNIEKFKKLNNSAYSNKDISLKSFRNETLNLINPLINKNFISKIKQIKEWNQYFNEGDFTNSIRFYVAGLYISKKVHIYPEVTKYINVMTKLYGQSLKILFLSSGYQCFIKGVVDGIFINTNCNYNVIGSELTFTEGLCKEKFHLNQFEKQNIIEIIIKKGSSIHFLADDSKDNPDLFTLVEKNGGKTLLVKYIKNCKKNPDWVTFSKNLSFKRLKNQIKNDNKNYALDKTSSHLPSLLEEITKNTNDIGIVSLNKTKFDKALCNLCKLITVREELIKFKIIINKLTFVKNNNVFLRGELYYHWLPPYIFPNTNTSQKKWTDLLNYSLKGIEIITHHILNKTSLIGLNEKLILYSFFDHIISALLECLYVNEKTNLALNNKNKNDNSIQEITQKAFDLLYFFLNENNITKSAENFISEFPKEKIISAFHKYNKPHYKGMRELDNYASIFKSVNSIINSSKKNNINFDYLISFPYGGIALGYSYISCLKLKNYKKIPTLINCYFSSHKEKRKELNKINYYDDNWLFTLFPSNYLQYIKDIKNGNANILIYDNNATTFKTLNKTKVFLNQYGNNVYSSVVSINYNNVCNYLLNKQAESLSDNWHKFLDFKPIDEYITAFNTWGSSHKSKQLEKIFFTRNNVLKINNKKTTITNNFIFKLCRVHNLYDLKIAIKNGVNMIGVHAVYPERYKYLTKELPYKPIKNTVNFDLSLPISVLEIESIRAMQKNIPENVKQAILFEQFPGIEQILKCCNIYGMEPKKTYIQLQHRIDQKIVKQIKDNVSKKLIIAIGIFQYDFKEYFYKLQNILDSKDYILLDLSKHQPDLISHNNNLTKDNNKILALKKLAEVMSNNKVPILIADDTTPNKMNQYIKILTSANVLIAGIDMQNNVEIPQNEQKYQLLHDTLNGNYQIKIRKSANMLDDWFKFTKKYKLANNYILSEEGNYV